jgi:hypothetical protein
MCAGGKTGATSPPQPRHHPFEESDDPGDRPLRCRFVRRVVGEIEADGRDAAFGDGVHHQMDGSEREPVADLGLVVEMGSEPIGEGRVLVLRSDGEAVYLAERPKADVARNEEIAEQAQVPGCQPPRRR